MMEMQLSAIVLLALAVYSIGRMLSDVELGGPWQILDRLRHFVGVEFDERSMPYGRNVLAQAMLCQYCNSFWIGLTVTLLYFFTGDVIVWLLSPFSFHGIVAIIADWRYK